MVRSSFFSNCLFVSLILATLGVHGSARGAASKQQPEYRTWTSADGNFTVEAKLIKVAGPLVHLQRKDNGRVIQVPISRISQKDRSFVKSVSSGDGTVATIDSTDETVPDQKQTPSGKLTIGDSRTKVSSEAIAVLEEALYGDDDEIRWRAGHALGQFGKESIPALEKALQSNDPKIRYSAGIGLRGVGPASLPALARALHHERDTVRTSAAAHLSSLAYEWWKGTDRAVSVAPAVVQELIPLFIKALESDERHMAAAAAQGLGLMGPEAREAIPALIEAFFENDDSIRVRLGAAALVRIGPDALPALEKAMENVENENWAIRELVAEALGQIGQKAIPILERALQDKNQLRQYPGCRGLKRMGPRAVGALERNLRSKEACVEATYLLGDMGAVGVPALEIALEHEQQSVRLVAVMMLENAGVRAVPELERALQDTDAHVRCAAAGALGKMGPVAKQSIAALEQLLQSDDWTTRFTAVWALAQMGPEAQSVLDKALEDDDEHVRSISACGVGKPGRASLPSLEEALFHPHPSVSLGGGWALGKMGAPAVPILEKAFNAGRESPLRPPLVTAALTGLGNLGADAIPALEHPLREQGQNVETLGQVTAALSRIGVEAIPVLVKGLDTFRYGAARALAEIGPEAIPPLEETLRKKKKTSAAHVLASIGPDALPALERALGDEDRRVCGFAVSALGEMGPIAVPYLRPYLEKELLEGSPGSAHHGLVKMGSDAMPTLEKALRHDDWRVRVYAVHILGRIGQPAASILEQRSQDQHPLVRAVTTGALREIERSSRKVEEQRSLDGLIRQAWHAEQRGDLQQAIAFAEQAVAAKTDDPFVLYLAANLCYSAGYRIAQQDPKAADQMFRKSAGYMTKFAEAAENLSASQRRFLSKTRYQDVQPDPSVKVKAGPVIDDLAGPQDAAVFAGETVQFSIEFSSISAITANQWYFSNDGGTTFTELTDGAARPSGPGATVSIGIDETGTPKTATLTIAGTGTADEGLYKCKLTDAGGADESNTVGLAVKRLVAHYAFEDNLTDAVFTGTNDGTAKNTDPARTPDISYTTGVVGKALLVNSTTDAADPNQSYVELPMTAYPKAGPGGGLEAGTILCWVKTEDTGAVMGTFNDGYSTGFVAEIYSWKVLVRGEGVVLGRRLSQTEPASLSFIVCGVTPPLPRPLDPAPLFS